MEAMVKGQQEKRDQFPRFITCPNEVRYRIVLNPSSLRYGQSSRDLFLLIAADGCPFHGRRLRPLHFQTAVCHCAR